LKCVGKANAYAYDGDYNFVGAYPFKRQQSCAHFCYRLVYCVPLCGWRRHSGMNKDIIVGIGLGLVISFGLILICEIIVMSKKKVMVVPHPTVTGCFAITVDGRFMNNEENEIRTFYTRAGAWQWAKENVKGISFGWLGKAFQRQKRGDK
jgi:hypothetical protein